MEMLAKLTTKGVVGTVGKLDDGALYTVIGIAIRTETKETNYGDSVLIHGSFKAIRASDKAVFAAGKAFLPALVTEAIQNGLAMSDGKPIEFAVEIGKKSVEKKDGTEGYEYTVKPLIDTSVNSPLEQLAERAGVALLAAPVAKKEESPVSKKGKK